MKNTKVAKRVYWAKHVEDWKASGESQSRYCRRNSLNTYQLTYWAQVLKSKPIAIRSKAAKGFVAVQVTTPTTQAHGLTIRLPNGIQLEGVSTGNLAVVREMMGWPL